MYENTGKIEFKIRIEEDARERILYRYDEIVGSIARLSKVEDSFIVVESNPLINNVTFMQACYIVKKKKNFFNKTITNGFYYIEVQTTDDDGNLTSHELETNDIKTCINVFSSYFNDHKIPDFKDWTSTLFIPGSPSF